jgi:hypothetical protein
MALIRFRALVVKKTKLLGAYLKETRILNLITYINLRFIM